jgi:hypothetical protein
MNRQIGRTLNAQLFATVAAALLLHTSSVPAATNTVTNHKDDGSAGSLRAMIAASPSGDTINFDLGVTGTISMTNGGLDITHHLTVLGPGASVLTVSGHSNGE